MPTGADPPSRGGDACIYQIKTNPVSPLPAPAGGRAPAALVTLDNLVCAAEVRCYMGDPGWCFTCTLMDVLLRVFHMGLRGWCLTRESTGRFDV